MKKIFGILLIVFIVAAMFTGCFKKEGNSQGAKVNSSSEETTQNETVKEEPESEKGTVETQEKSAYPMTVKDGKGNEIVLENKPVNIISLSLGTDEILVSIIEKERLKAISSISQDHGISNIADKAADFEKIGTNSEKIVAAGPDLVFVPDYIQAEFIKQLRNAGIKVYIPKTPNSVEEVKNTVMELAVMLDAKEKGEELVGWMDAKLNEVAGKVASISEDDRKTILSLDSFFNTYGIGTSFDSVARHAGLKNLAASEEIEGWQPINKEKVVELNPEVVILPSWSYEGFDAEQFSNDLKNDKSLKDVAAVAEGMVISIPEKDLTSVSQYIVQGVEGLAKAAYPELFE